MSETALHAVHWFEIPALDLERAEVFYGQICCKPSRRETAPGRDRYIPTIGTEVHRVDFHALA